MKNRTGIVTGRWDIINPTDEVHGNFGNLEVDEDGEFEHEVMAEKLTMRTGEPNSLADQDDSAHIIQSGEDDLDTYPAGDSSDCHACVLIFPQMDGDGENTPVMTPEATPAN